MASEEVQILRGPGLTVTDQRVTWSGGEIAISDINAPSLGRGRLPVPAGPTLYVVGGVIAAVAALLQSFPLVLTGLAILAAAKLVKISQPVTTLGYEADGARRVIYATRSEADAKLALAALEEALRRFNARA